MPRYVDLSNPKIFHNGRDKYGNGIYHIPPDLPTDDVAERKKGKWIVVSDGYGNGEATSCICECSECKDTMWVYKRAGRRWNFCPNCGAEME